MRKGTPSLNLKPITSRGCYHSPNLKRVTRTDHQATKYGARRTFMALARRLTHRPRRASELARDATGQTQRWETSRTTWFSCRRSAVDGRGTYIHACEIDQDCDKRPHTPRAAKSSYPKLPSSHLHPQLEKKKAVLKPADLLYQSAIACIAVQSRGWVFATAWTFWPLPNSPHPLIFSSCSSSGASCRVDTCTFDKRGRPLISHGPAFEAEKVPTNSQTPDPHALYPSLGGANQGQLIRWP